MGSTSQIFYKGREVGGAQANGGGRNDTAPSSTKQIGDVSGDSKPDLAIANAGSNDVCALLNQGKGKFASPVRYNLGHLEMMIIAAVSLADFNEDGELDIATANFNPKDVAIVLNKGDGSFAKEKRFSVPDKPFSLWVADLDGDVKPDLVTANIKTNEVSVLLNIGDVSFTPPEQYQVGHAPAFVIAVDLNEDGKPDLVTANKTSNDISVLLNQGEGSFFPEKRFSVEGNRPSSVCASDFNNDGKVDIAVANSGSNSVSVLLSLQ